MPTSLLYCRDPLRPRRVDEHFASEASTAPELGATVALIDHDALTRGDTAAAVARVPVDLGPAWYRGWMLNGEQYSQLDTALRDRGAELLTTPAMYRAAHELPGWYEVFAELTATSVWVPARPDESPSDAALRKAVADLPPGRAVIKDFVKSRKHEPDAFYIPDLSDPVTVRAVVSRLVERQGPDLVGGVVLRAFEDFRLIDGGVAQTRVWWLDGNPIVVGPHPDDRDHRLQPDLTVLRRLIPQLPCRFVTTDLAQHVEGHWRLIELGDAQVSDFPSGVDRSPLLSALTAARAGHQGSPVQHHSGG